MESVLMMDCGDAKRRADNGCIGRGPTAVIADMALRRGDAGKFLTNRGATGAVVVTLPAPIRGVFFVFGRAAAQTFTVAASGGAKIDASAVNGSVSVGTALVTIASDGHDWFSTIGVFGGAISGAVAIDPNGVATIGETLVQYAETSILAANVLALFTTGYEVVPAPAAGKFNDLIGASIILDAGGTPYAIGAATNLALFYRADGSGDQLTVNLDSTGFLDNATDLVRCLKLTSTNVEPVVGVNGKIVLKLDGANVTLGNGILRVKASYRVHTSGL